LSRTACNPVCGRCVAWSASTIAEVGAGVTGVCIAGRRELVIEPAQQHFDMIDGHCASSLFRYHPTGYPRLAWHAAGVVTRGTTPDAAYYSERLWPSRSVSLRYGML